MYCAECGSRMEDSDRFCRVCGAPIEQEAGESPAAETAPQPGCTAEAQGGYPSYPAYPPVNNARGQYPPRQRNVRVRVREPKPKRRRVYRELPSGRKTLCLVLCLLMVLFSFISMMIVTARVGLSEDNVRSAYREGDLKDVTVVTASGKISLADLVMQSAVSVKTNEPIGLEREQALSFLRKTSVNDFVENILVDYAACFVFGKEAAYLNADKISHFLSLVSFDARHEIGYYIPDSEIRSIRQRVDSGDLAYLNLEDTGAFKERYGVDPKMISTVFSVWVMIVSALLAVVCSVLIMVLCSKNAPAGLGYIGTTLTAYGALNLFLAVAAMIISAVSDVFFISAVLRTLAMAMGIFSMIPLMVGILMLLVRGALKKNAAADGQENPPAAA